MLSPKSLHGTKYSTPLNPVGYLCRRGCFGAWHYFASPQRRLMFRSDEVQNGAINDVTLYPGPSLYPKPSVAPPFKEP